MHPPFPDRITIGHLVIRRWNTSDVDTMEQLIRDNLDHLRPWMGWAVNEPLPPARRLRMFKRWDRLHDTSSGTVYAIEHAGQLVGGCAIHRRPNPTTAELGCWLAQRATGRGIATAVAGALADAAARTTGIQHVQISHAPANHHSAAIAQRLGFTPITSDQIEPGTVWRLTATEILARFSDDE